jgi:hypothetical protein
MKSKYALAIKFFTESKNEEQLELSYKEIESFMDTYETFKFYLKFSVDEIPLYVLENLTEDERYKI